MAKRKKNIFEKTLEAAQAAGYEPNTDVDASLWFKRKLTKLSYKPIVPIIRESPRKVATLPKNERRVIGRFWTYHYDPITKATLPYYDKFPMSLILEVNRNSFDALNFHYLPPFHRTLLYRKLLPFKRKYAEGERIRMTYDMLKSAKKFKAFRPAYKRYVKEGVKSRFLEIKPEEWEIAMQLPTQKFVGESAQNVWKESRRKINA
jgi:hypothetical protein